MNLKKQGFMPAAYHRTCGLVLFFIAAAASFNGFYDKWQFRELGSTNYSQSASLDTVLDGTAARPYVYRQLLPMLANWIDSKVPEHTKDALFRLTFHSVHAFAGGFASSPLLQSRAYFLRYLVVYFSVFLFAWISVCAMYQMGKAAGARKPVAALAAIAMILVLPYFFASGGYYYDYPELAFLIIVAWMAFKVDWWWIVPVAALATLNKESFLLFIPSLYPLLRTRNPRAKAIVGTVALGCVCAAVSFWLRLRFQHNPGGTVEIHWKDQIDFFLHPMGQFRRERTYGLDLFKSFNVFSLGLIAWAVWRGWRLLPRSIQRHAQIAAVINLPLWFLFCYPGELRDLSLIYVAFLLLLTANLNEWAKDGSAEERFGPVESNSADELKLLGV
jgi:hypothetical protein